MPASLNNFLQNHKAVYVDTSVFIYFVEKKARYHEICESIFKDIESGAIQASTSTLTLLEVLVTSYKLKRDDLVLSFYSLFSTYPNISWVNLTLGISDLAAKLRAEHGLKTPEAIQAASAISCGAKGFICNDGVFEKVKDLDCLIMDDCL